MIIDIEHFGVKGMHWGVTTSVSGNFVNKPKQKKKQLLLEKKKKIGNVSLSVGLADARGRNAIVQAFLTRRHKKKLKDFNMNQQQIAEAKNLIEENKDVKV